VLTAAARRVLPFSSCSDELAKVRAEARAEFRAELAAAEVPLPSHIARLRVKPADFLNLTPEKSEQQAPSPNQLLKDDRGTS
jgi:hypothetical protein